MSSNDFNYSKEYRLHQGETVQQPITAIDSHGQRHGSNSSTPYYRPPPTSSVSYPANYHSQPYQSRPMDSSSYPDYNSQWYSDVPTRNISRQALETGAVGGVDMNSDQRTSSQRNTKVLSYDTSALGSLAYASGLQYSGAGNGQMPQDANESVSISQPAHTQQPQTQYRSSIRNLAAAAAEIANGYQQPGSDSANTSDRQSVVGRSHRAPPMPSESISPITASTSSYLQASNTAQKSPNPKVTSYFRPSMGNISSIENRDPSNISSTIPGTYQPSKNQQAYQYENSHAQSRIDSQPPIQRQAHPQVHPYSHSQNKTHASSTQTREANEWRRGTLPATTHAQRLSTAQTFHQAKTSSEQSKSVPSQANQNLLSHSLRRPHEALQSNTVSYQQQQQQHDSVPTHSPNNGQTSHPPSQVLHQHKPSGLTTQGQLNHQLSNPNSSKVISPTLHAQYPQQLDESALSSSTKGNTVQHIQRPQNSSTSTPMTVNPNHVYNPYHERRRLVEVAEAEHAKQAASQAALSAAAAASSQPQQKLRHPVADNRSLSQWNNNLRVEDTTGDSKDPVNGTGEVKVPETTNGKDIGEAKKRHIIGKILDLMQEDPALFNNAIEELKTHTAIPSRLEQQQAVYPTPSQCSPSNASGRTAMEAKTSAKSHLRNRKPVNLPPPRPTDRQTSILTITQHSESEQPQQHVSTLPQPFRAAFHLTPSSTVVHNSGYPQPQQPKSTLTPSHGAAQGTPLESTFAQSFQPIQPQPSTGMPQTSPVKSASIWPEAEKETLGINAVRFLTSIPENYKKVVTSQQICAILDRNPNYVELCETIEAMGFRLDRIKFAKALLATVPDSHYTRPRAGEPPPANNIEGSAQNSARAPPLAIGNRHGQNTQASIAASDMNAIAGNDGRAHPPSGSTIVHSQPHALNSGTPTPTGNPTKRSRGGPRKAINPTQPKPDTASRSHVRREDDNDNATLNDRNNGSNNTQNSAGIYRRQQTSVTHSGIEGTSQGSHSHKDFRPSNLANFHSAVHSTPLNHNKASMSGTERIHGDYGGLIDSASLKGHARGRNPFRAASNASFSQPPKTPNFSPSKLLIPPSLPAPKESTHVHGFSSADIEQLAQDPYDLEPELPDHLAYLERCRRADHDQSQATGASATNVGFATKAVNMGLPSRADSATSTPQSTSAPQSRISKTARLRSAFRVKRRPRDGVGNTLAYNPKKISRDLLIAVGKHPATRPLNAHIERIKHKANYVQIRAELGAIYWDSVDPGLPALEAANKTEPTAEMDTDEDTPKTTHRTQRQLSENDEAARDDERINSGSSNSRSENTSPIPGGASTLKRKSRSSISSPSPSPSSGAVPSTFENETPSSSGDTDQQNRSFLVDAPTGNSERRRLATTPAQPSKLRNEVAPDSPASRLSSSPIVVIPSRFPSVLAEYTPYAADQAENIFMAKSPAYDPGPSGHMVFKCEWLDCNAELHNFAALRKHVTTVHRVKETHGLYQCHWRGCGKVIEHYDEKGKLGLVKRPVNFQNVASLDYHMEQEHLTSIRRTLGLGPRAGPEDEDVSETSERYLTDMEGRRLMPLSSFTNWRGKNVTESIASSPPGAESHRLPTFLTDKRPADADLPPRMKAKRVAAITAYERVLKHYQTAGPTVVVPPSCTFDPDKNRRATLKSEALYMVVKGSYDPIQMILDKGKADHSSRVEEDVFNKEKEHQDKGPEIGWNEAEFHE
ncbi:hypothetical protein GP486_002377 [Trichoglossum hirsutum]|uniref:C2H2-type domain-containing protein n=1 Tax=Trichoglossum hirsutum TaxID=265104 RepID=A0A9P8LF71_9PEZI|nr:hypothetical protein GP486_002377 [Trichoglossum hirsutum]